MNTVIIIVILIVIAGAGYYFYSRSNSSSPSPSSNSSSPGQSPTQSPSQSPSQSVNNNMIGIWDVNQYNSDGSLTNNNYTLNFQSDGKVIASTNKFPLTNMSWTPTTWSGTMSSGQKTTLPLTYSNNAISLYVTNNSGASPYLVLKPTPAPTTPSPTTPSPATPTPATPSVAATTSPSSPASTVTPTIGPFKPTSPPVENALGVTGQTITLWGGTPNQILNICYVDIFPDPYNAPYLLTSSSVKITASSTDPDHKSLSANPKGSYFATLAGDPNPFISINLGADLPIYKIVVYNRVDDRVQRICGLTLTIENSRMKTVYTSDGVMCTQLATNSDKSLQKGVTSKNNVIRQDSKGDPISEKTFNDYGNTNNDLAIYSNTGTIVYFPTPGTTNISQGPPINIFRGSWVDANRDNFLIIRNDGTLSYIKNGVNMPGVYQQFGLNAYVVLKPPQTTYYTGTLSGWCQTNDRFPISSAEIQYSGVEYNPNTKINFGHFNSAFSACSKTGPDIMTIGANSVLTYKDVKYYFNFETDNWFCYGDSDTYDVTTYNKNIKGESTKKDYLKQRLGKSYVVNRFIGSWMTNDLPNPVIFTFNPDMTCSDRDGTYQYRLSNYIFSNPSNSFLSLATTSTTSNSFLSLVFRKNKSEYQLDYYHQNDIINAKVITDGVESSNIKLLRNPFVGTWTSKTKRSPITFTINATVTGFVMVDGIPQDQYWVNPPNSQTTAIFGSGYITGSIKGNPGLSSNNLVMAYDIDSDIIYVYLSGSYANPVDTLTH